MSQELSPQEAEASAGRIMMGIGAAVALAGLSLMVYVGLKARDIHRQKAWPSVPGLVESCSHHTVTDRKRRSWEELDLRYRYQVGGEDFVGERVSTEQVTGTDWTMKRVARYPKGKEVRVYYDPEAPDFSVLEPGSHEQPFLYLAFGFAIFSIGLGVIHENRPRKASREGKS